LEGLRCADYLTSDNKRQDAINAEFKAEEENSGKIIAGNVQALI
jgi:hypothetical protein